MRAAALLLVLQSAVYGPPAPKAGADDNRPAGCTPGSSSEVVVCGQTRMRDQRLSSADTPGGGNLDQDGRIDARLSDKTRLGGGGPMGQKGQSVGLTLRMGF